MTDLPGGWISGLRPDEPLRVLQVSTTDVGGGAEKVAWDLFRAYRAAGHRSWLAVGQKRTTDDDVLTIPNGASGGPWRRAWFGMSQPFRRLQHAAPGARAVRFALETVADPRRSLDRSLDWWRGYEDFNFADTWRLLHLFPERPHVLHAHNLHGGYFDLRALPWLSQQIPVILTLHDAWLLSGHCAHSFDCERWKIGCGQCPDLTIYPAVRRDETAYNWRQKQGIYARSRLYVATPSRWLARRVEQSMLAPAVVDARIIPNGIDLSVFRRADRGQVRARLGIPPDAWVVLCTAGSVRGSPWRDAQAMRAAIDQVASQLSGRDLRFIAMGDAGREQIGRAVVQFVPHQRDPHAVARFYQAADVYVHPAKIDTFSLTVVEAMACGTPVVATAVGGVPELIEDGRTGCLVPPGDAAALARVTVALLEDDDLRAGLGHQARESVERSYDLVTQAGHYLAWYAAILQKAKADG